MIEWTTGPDTGRMRGMGRPRARGTLALLLGLSLPAAAGCKGEKFEEGEGGAGNGDTGGSGGKGGAANGGTGAVEPPADVSGTYTVAITNGTAESNVASCPASTWMEGAMTTGLRIVIMQNGSAIQGQLEEGAAIAAWLALGTTSFSGSVSGNDVHMVIFGTTMYTEGACMYTIDATTDATLNGDALSGTIAYTAVLGSDPACDGIVCTANQRFSGSRPPR